MSQHRILTTHVGSLPRTKAVTDVVFAKENDVPVDQVGFDRVIEEATNSVVKKQKEIGIDIPSDGEMSKISYATYIRERLTGFAGDHPREPPQDLELFSSYLERLAKSGGTPKYRRPCCVGPVKVENLTPLHDDLTRMRSAMDLAQFDRGFMNSASPGVISLFQPNQYYEKQEDYLSAVAEAMREEFEAIVAAGLDLQIDAPDLGLGRHMLYKSLSDDEFVQAIGTHVDVLNHALRNIPEDKIRMHVCWGNYEGPHIFDVALQTIIHEVLRAKPRQLLIEGANPRHAHEWAIWKEIDLPSDYILMPGVIDSTSNFVEHPELVCQRILQIAGLVGSERVVASTDCGFATFAGYGAVDADVAWAKLESLVAGARLATERHR